MWENYYCLHQYRQTCCSGIDPKWWHLLCSFPRGCSSIARMTLLSKTKYRKLCLLMVGSLEYLIKVVSFTKLQGDAGPLGEGNAPSNCIILWRIENITVNSWSKSYVHLMHQSVLLLFWIFTDTAMFPFYSQIYSLESMLWSAIIQISSSRAKIHLS